MHIVQCALNIAQLDWRKPSPIQPLLSLSAAAQSDQPIGRQFQQIYFLTHQKVYVKGTNIWCNRSDFLLYLLYLLWFHLVLFQRKCGVIVYDDLNHPHMVEADQEILTQYSTPTTMKNRRVNEYQAATLSTFSLGSPPGIRSPPGSVLGIRSPLPDTPGIHQVTRFLFVK